MKNGISLGCGALWVLIWVGFMFFYTLLNVAVWKKICPAGEKYLNLLSIAACTAAFLILLARKNQFQVDLSGGITLRGILLAAGCAVLFYLLLDKGLDPVLGRLCWCPPFFSRCCILIWCRHCPPLSAALSWACSTCIRDPCSAAYWPTADTT